MALRINSSSGLVLHTGGGQRGAAMMSLSVSDGHLQLLLTLDGAKKKVNLRSRKKYNDNRWHTVSSEGNGDVATGSGSGDVVTDGSLLTLLSCVCRCL